MITARQIEAGLKRGVFRLITDPNMEMGTVCAIGDNWFYFGGETAEKLSPDEYIREIPIEDIVQEILDTLSDFQDDEGLSDEYRYYESILNEQIGDVYGKDAGGSGIARCPQCSHWLGLDPI